MIAKGRGYVCLKYMYFSLVGDLNLLTFTLG